MQIKKIYSRVKGVSGMSFYQAETLRNFILENQFSKILELGFNHGISTCYMAGVLDELGSGTITTIDLETAQNAKPDLESLLNDLGLSKFVTSIYEPTSYVWALMKMLEETPQPAFDFCYIDGAHDWYTDGFAFFLVDKLLTPGGWIIFDDFDWIFETSPSLKNSERVKNMPIDERTTPQIRKVFELLVEQHFAYSDFIIKDGWGYAHKIVEKPLSKEIQIKKKIVYQPIKVGLGSIILILFRKIKRILSKYPL